MKTQRFAEGKRAMTLTERPKYDPATRTAVISFSSEYPVERMAMGQLYREILSHDPGAMRTERLSQTVNVIDSHDTSTIKSILGVVERYWVGSDHRGYAEIRFADTPDAQHAATLMQQDILRNVSFGYRILDYVDRSADEMLVTAWEPYEISLLSTPADPSVGYARALETGAKLFTDPPREVRAASTPAASANTVKGKAMEVMEKDPASAGATPRVEVIDNGANQERLRYLAIDKLSREHKIDENVKRNWIDSGVGIDVVTQQILDMLSERAKSNPQTPALLGMSKKETQSFSLFRAINALATKDWSKAGFELEASRAVQQRIGKLGQSDGFFVPFEVQTRVDPQAKRDMTVATSAQGGYLVQTSNQGFIPMLRNRSVLYKMGATQLPGMRDNVAIPKLTGGASFGWLATEATAATESTPALGQLLLTPKTIAGYVEVSRLLTLQSSPAAEALIEADLADGVAVALDLAGLSGSGTGGAPTGVTATAGIGSVSGTSLGYAGIIEFQTDVASSNVMPVSGGYVTTPAVAGSMKQKQRFASTDTPIWQGNIWDGVIEGFPAMSSLQMAAASMLFGDFAQVVIAEWGVMEIQSNPYANFPAGITGLRVMYTVDVGVRYAGAFSLATTIT